MSIIQYLRQYRPISAHETATNDALSTRAVQDLAWSINNAKAHAMAPDIIQTAWPTGSLTHATTNEDVLHVFAPRGTPNGYNLIWVTGCAVMNAANTHCNITLYMGRNGYAGALQNICEGDRQTMGVYTSTKLTFDETASNVKAGSASHILYDGGDLHCMLTAKCNAGSSKCTIMALSASARIYSTT